MDNRNTNEDDIDTETLQAQIDLSMSFAQNLVSSWIKQPRKLSNRNWDVETELKEHMRRPPRWLFPRPAIALADCIHLGLELEHLSLRLLAKQHG